LHDEPGGCVYLPGRVARLPLRLPARQLSRGEFRRRLEEGDRRQGVLLYRPTCPTCRACQPIRIEVDAFRPSRTQRRILRRGDAELEIEIGRPSLTIEKVELYNRHKVERDLVVGEDLVDPLGYEQFLVESCADTIEIRYRRRGALVGVAVTDRAEGALSAVYFYFDPDHGALSPGTYSILKQLDLCRRWGLRHLYLGLYVGGCRALEYKVSYRPHERLVDGVWRRFE
jgi:arginyl-tRNA--protein-N-Asp/Glu arginylyltransferase